MYKQHLVRYHRLTGCCFFAYFGRNSKSFSGGFHKCIIIAVDDKIVSTEIGMRSFVHTTRLSESLFSGTLGVASMFKPADEATYFERITILDTRRSEDAQGF